MTRFSADVHVPIGAEVALDRLKAVLESLDRAKQATVLDERSISVRTKVGFLSWGERGGSWRWTAGVGF